MDGFLDAASGSYDFSRDAAQRRMLQEAKVRGATLFEAFANSPPYWMTVSGCASGGAGGAENLSSSSYQAFATYLATVVKHFHDVEGITFESLEAFNEPDGGWWGSYGSQEGFVAPIATQNAVLPLVAAALTTAGLPTFVAVLPRALLNIERCSGRHGRYATSRI